MFRTNIIDARVIAWLKKADGFYGTNWKGIQTLPNWEPPIQRFGGGLIPLLPFGCQKADGNWA